MSLTLETVRVLDLDHSIALETSGTTRAVDIKERALASLYRKFAKLIINDPEYPALGNIREYYNGAYVYPVTQRAIHDIYLQGVDYVNLFFRTQGFLSKSKDDPRIDELTREMVDAFWNKIRVYTNRRIEHDNAIAMNVKDVPKLFDINYMMNVTATTLATWTLRIATVEKLRDMKDQISKLQYKTIKNEVKASVAIKGMGRAILEDINAVNREDIKSGKERKLTTDDIWFIWYARLDERTCTKLPDGGQGCKYLHGKRWKFDDASEVPNPAGTGRNPTHYNCRCRILIQIGKDAFFA